MVVCPTCLKNKDETRTEFVDTQYGVICEECFEDKSFEVFKEYIESEINQEIPDSVIRKVASDMGIFSSLRTRADESALSFLLKMCMYDENIELTLEDFEAYLKDYKKDAKDVIKNLKQANFLIDTRKGEIYRPGENAKHFARMIKMGRAERDVVKLAYGTLNIALLRTEDRHKTWLRTILAVANEILEKQRESGELTFEIHISEFFKHCKKYGIRPANAINNLDRFLGNTPDSDGTPVIFDDIDYLSGYQWSPDNPTWDFNLSMSKEWVQIRERINSRIRER